MGSEKKEINVIGRFEYDKEKVCQVTFQVLLLFPNTLSGLFTRRIPEISPNGLEHILCSRLLLLFPTQCNHSICIAHKQESANLNRA